MMVVIQSRSALLKRFGKAQVHLTALMLFMVGSVAAQDTLKIASYNLLNYPGSDASTRNPYFRAVLNSMKPDVLVVQEMTSQAGVDTFRDGVLNASQPGLFSSVLFNNGPDTDNSFFYKSSKVVYFGATYIPTALRDIAEYRFKRINSPDTVRIFSVHLKANQSDTLARRDEATILRNYLNALPPGSNFIVVGDFNTYYSSEPALVKLLESEANNNGRCKDPLNSVGNWHSNIAFRSIHTQSPRIRAFGGGSTGGMDDRFDLMLISYPMDQHIITSSYTAYGNDGNHFNDSINRLPNTAVPDSVANGLHYGSDHLTIFAKYVFGGSAPGGQIVSVNSGNWNSPATWNGGVVPSDSSSVLVNTGHVVTIDGSAVAESLTVAGVLQFDATDGRSLVTSKNLTIANGGMIRASDAFSSGPTTQLVNIGGDFVNNGTFAPRVTGSTSGTRVANMIFNGNSSAVISGSTNPTSFNTLTMNMGSPSTTLMPLVNLAFVGSTNALTLARGTWMQNSGQTVTPNVNITVDTNAVLAIGGSGTFSTGSASLIVRGTLNVLGGTLNVGNGNNRLEVLGGGSASFTGGATNIGGRLTLTAGTTMIQGGSITIDPRGAAGLAATSNVFEAAAAASVSMFGGTLTIVDPKVATQTGREIKISSGTGAKAFTGGVISLGDGVSNVAGSDSGFVIESSVPLPALILRTGGTAGRDVSMASPIAVSELKLESGALKLFSPFLPGFDLTVNGSIARSNGGLVSGPRAVSVLAPPHAGADTISGSFVGLNAFANLTLSNPAGVIIAGDVEVNSVLSIGNCAVMTGMNTIILGPGAVLAESEGCPVVGRVRTTRVVAQGTGNAFGGIGLEMNAGGAAPGTTSIVRTTGVASILGGSSILRYFEISSGNNANLDATIAFHFDPSELNTNNASLLRLWESNDAGATWQPRDGTVDTAARTVTVSGIQSFARWTAADTLHFTSGALMRSYAMSSGWNLISVPLMVGNFATSAVFPTAVSPAFAYVGGSPPQGYVQRDTLQLVDGYWLKFGSGQMVTVSGYANFADTVMVMAGWNLVGAITDSVAISTIQQSPPGIVSSQFFGYDGSYSPASILAPARSYWVKASQDGLLMLNTNRENRPKKSPSSSLDLR